MSQLVEVKIPDIGDFKDVPVIEVFVKVGDTVKVEDPLVSLESDKATMDVPSSAAGVVKEIKVKKGDKVLIKVNICGGVPEIRGTFTSTEVVGVLVNRLKALGAEIMIGDADMVWTKFWQAASDSGWTKWARENNVKMQNLSESRIAWSARARIPCRTYIAGHRRSTIFSRAPGRCASEMGN